jgi:chitosanase
MTDLQKATSEAIVNIFETGRVRGRYSAVTVIKGDTGHLSYGRSQAALGSGSLYTLLKDYCAASGARHAQELLPLLPRFRDKDLTLDQDQQVRALLQTAGDDPVMQRVQDGFFDRNYWTPAVTSAKNRSFSLALSTTVIYDSRIHGNFDLVRQRVKAGLDEKAWVVEYLSQRKAWLLSCSDPLPKTVYRMDEFSKLIAAGKWELELPMTVRGVVINEEVLGVREEPVAARAPDPALAGRVLQMSHPYMRGEDVRKLQTALNNFGFSSDVDAVFGPMTEVLVKQFQRKRGLNPDGVVGPMTWLELNQETAGAAAHSD